MEENTSLYIRHARPGYYQTWFYMISDSGGSFAPLLLIRLFYSHVLEIFPRLLTGLNAAVGIQVELHEFLMWNGPRPI